MLIFFTICVTKDSSASLDPPFTVFPLMHSALHILFLPEALLWKLNFFYFFAVRLHIIKPTLQHWLREAALAPHFGSWCSSRWKASNLHTSLSPLHPLEHHSDPVGASDRDLCHPNGVLCPLLRCVRVLPGSVLLPRQEEKQTLWQISEIIDFFFHA